ncbi:ABC transporter ATP-binding protein, partial [Paenibacillus validus]|nr:ABC transporter ATP-binding protein [Paenibacillus validus]
GTDTPGLSADAGSDEQPARIAMQMNPDDIPLLSKRLIEAGVELHGIEIKLPTLEDLFLKVTEGERIG